VAAVASMSRFFGYDAENRQISANVNGTNTYYAYDGAGQRVQKTVGTNTPTVYVYDAFGNLTAEYGSTNSTTGTNYFSTDHLGSTRLVTKADGTVSQTFDYLPFGEEIGGTASTGPTQRFTGQERDTESGLDNFVARYFSGPQGRFMSPDPIGNLAADPADPQSWNLFSYVGNRPQNSIDSTGLRCTVVNSGIDTNIGTYDQSIPASAASYPYSGFGLGIPGGILGVLQQGHGGKSTQGGILAAKINQYANEPGGVDVVNWSGSGQAFVSGVSSGQIGIGNIASVTYLSPGLAPGQNLVSVGPTAAFHGSGVVDWGVTAVARLSGAKLQDTLPNAGHDLLAELGSPAVQAWLRSVGAGVGKGSYCGSNAPAKPPTNPPPPFQISTPPASFSWGMGIGGDPFGYWGLIYGWQVGTASSTITYK
jgi:RHS repeat-associated protein